MSSTASDGGGSSSESVEKHGKAQKLKSKGGRPKNEIWIHFTEGDARQDCSHRVMAKCNYCSCTLVARVEQMKTHVLEYCPSTTPEVRQKLEVELAKDMPAPAAPTAGRAMIKAARAKGQQLVTSSFRSEKPFSVEENFAHNVELLRWFVTSSIPFNVLNNPFFLSYIGMVSSNRSSPAGEKNSYMSN
jgi:hypothetical protein